MSCLVGHLSHRRRRATCFFAAGLCKRLVPPRRLCGLSLHPPNPISSTRSSEPTLRTGPQQLLPAVFPLGPPVVAARRKYEKKIVTNRHKPSKFRIITVHGRTKEQKGRAVASCNWDAIRRVKEALPVPVFSNGAIASLEDVER